MRKKISSEEKIIAVEKILTNKIGIREIARELGIAYQSIQKWVAIYKGLGIEGLLPQAHNRGYSKELKEQAVKEYLAKKGSLIEICTKFGIRSHAQLQRWILVYNGHSELKSSSGGNAMTKGRKTTFEEKIEIIKSCIENSHNYNEIAEKYEVSYQQVRSWTVKFEKHGVEALHDNRGKRKQAESMTETEKLRAQNKLLEAQNRRLELENKFLKKLKELERGW